MTDGLQVRDLSYLRNGPYNLHLAPGECCGISGVSGAGKSLLLRAIADVIPHGGECFLDSVSAFSFTPQEWRRCVAMVPAESYWWYDIVEPHFHGSSWGAPLLLELFARLGFEREVLQWQVSRLSTGERQRLSLIRTLVTGPRVLLLDEPTSGLDGAMASEVEKIVAEILAGHGCGCLWVSHDPVQLARIADRVFTLNAESLMEKR